MFYDYFAFATVSRTALLFAVLTCISSPAPAQQGPVPVRHAEGTLHGFLILTTLDGDTLAIGDLLQTVSGGTVESRMVFAFKDGSRHEETVTFTQDSVFRMERYQLMQRGPAFAADAEYVLEKDGSYRAVAREREAAEAEVHEGTIDLPADAYNGLVPVIVKNLEAGAEWTVHYVAFTPEPHVIELDIRSEPAAPVLHGDSSRTTRHWIVEPKLGLVRGFFASIAGKSPPDNHLWIVTQDVPIFVRSESPLYVGGPMWRIELTAPRWPSPVR
jgi:hypothetical protein